MFSKFFKKNKNYLDSRDKHDLLHNVYILYIIFVIAIADIFYILQVNDYYSAFIFISVGLLISFFSKNMVVILCITIIVTHILKYGSKWKEGFESNSETDNSEFLNYSEIDNVEHTEPTDSVEHTEPTDNMEHTEPTDNMEHTEPTDNMEHTESTDNMEHTESASLSDVNITKTSDKINKLLERQAILLDKLHEYKPFIHSIQNISKTFGLSTTAPPNNNITE